MTTLYHHRSKATNLTEPQPACRRYHQSRQRATSISIQYLLLLIGSEMTAFTSPSLISFTFGSRYLIRKYRTDEIRMHGCPVPYWGSRYGTDGPLTWLLLSRAESNRNERGAIGRRTAKACGQDQEGSKFSVGQLMACDRQSVGAPPEPNKA
jgi:hypothetical protein